MMQDFQPLPSKEGYDFAIVVIPGSFFRADTPVSLFRKLEEGFWRFSSTGRYTPGAVVEDLELAYYAGKALNR